MRVRAWLLGGALLTLLIWWTESRPRLAESGSPGVVAEAVPERQALREASAPGTARAVRAGHAPLPPGNLAWTNPPALRRPADELWRQVPAEHDFAAFRDWAERYRAAVAGEQSALEAEGVQLARARREDLKALIRTDPARALELVVPLEVRRELPDSVTALLEERVDGRGDLEVFAATPLPGQGSGFEPGWRNAVLGDRRLRAFVHGRREGQLTEFGVAMHGIAVDDQLALDENPVRLLEAAEAAAWLAADPNCGVSEQPANEFAAALAVDTGDEQPVVLCGNAHAEWLNQELIEVEESTGRLRRASAYTEGSKRLIFIRVDFSDRAGTPFTDATGTNLLRNLDTFFRENSMNRASFRAFGAGSSQTATLRMPRSAAQYGNLDPADLRTDARNAARNAGFNLASYDFDLICFTSVPNYSWGGLGYVGAPGSWIQGAFDVAAGVPAHELGHNFGLNHANFWDTAGESVLGSRGQDVEYGDSFDTMGNASAGKRHFNARNKVALDWLRASEFKVGGTNGVYRIYAHDVTNAVTGARALRVTKDARTNYWFEFRQKFPENRWLSSGLGVRWARSDNNRQSLLLDTTPGSASGKDDSPVVLGQTFSDHAAGIHVTVLQRNAGTPQSLDVMFIRGRFTNNIPPAVTVTGTPLTLTSGVTAQFQAAATDADGDALAYYWDFGDGRFGTNGPTASASWTTSGEYVVRCVVSDMRGGVGSDSVVVRVGSPAGWRLSGAVTREGSPLQGVRVFTSNTKFTHTDSDGSYVLTGIPNGSSVTLRAQAEGLLFTRSGFTNPVVVRAHTAGLDFEGSLPGDLELAALVPAGAEWRYNDSGGNLLTGWRAPAYNHTAWKRGAAPLGYGDDELVTTVGFGANSQDKHETTYFRHEFIVDDPARFLNVTLGLMRDDGGAVYLNGKEVFRSNLPSGTLTYQTLASDTVGGTDESTFFETELAAADFVKGRNVLAVEIHQVNVTSSDLRFDLRLDALLAPLAGGGNPPELAFVRQDGNLRLAWPSAFTGYSLQMRSSLAGAAEWQPTPYPVNTVGEESVVLAPLSEETRLFRLQK